MPQPRLRVANLRFLLLSLLLVLGILVWRGWTSPTHRAPSAAARSELTVLGHAGDAGHAVSAVPTHPYDPARAAAQLAEEPAQGITNAEGVLARIEAERRPEQRDEQTDALEIRALVSLTRIGAAHAKLQHFAEHYPTSRELPALVRLTGYHPRPMDRHTR